MFRLTIPPVSYTHLINKALGGSLRLFAEKVYEGSYFNRDEGEVVRSVYATLPNGSTLEQMNVLIKRMETYLSDFKEINPERSSVNQMRKKMPIGIVLSREADLLLPRRN